MATKTFNSRIVFKHDTEANWNKPALENFIPLAGEVIVYDADNNYTRPRIKIGDGSTTLWELSFSFEGFTLEELQNLCGAGL